MDRLLKPGLVLMAGITALVAEGTSYGVTQDQYADSIAAKTVDEVWTLLRGAGIGDPATGKTCRVAYVPTGSSCCVCNHYFKVATTDGLGYNGAPVYNTDNSDHSYYAGSATASRQNPLSPVSPQHSTGCFPQAGYGIMGGGATKWGGNNAAEVSTDAKAYAKNLVVQLLRDTSDPCSISPYLAKLGVAYQVEGTVTGSAGKISFADRGDGKPDPTKCYVDSNTTLLVNGVQSHLRNAYGNPTVCKQVFRRIRTVLSKSGVAVTSVPLISKQDQDLANAATANSGLLSGAITLAYDLLFQQAAATTTVYKTQTAPTTTLTATVNMSAASAPLSSVNLVVSSLQAQ